MGDNYLSVILVKLQKEIPTWENLHNLVDSNVSKKYQHLMIRETLDPIKIIKNE